jgi:hypothetical protein
MDIPQLTDLQVESLEAAVESESIIQILPNKDIDKEDVYTVWSGRVEQVQALIGLGLLQELPTDDDKIINSLKEQYPGRGFRRYAPTEIGKAMFSKKTRAIN